MPGGPVRTGSQTRCVLIRIVRHLPLGFVCRSCVLQQGRNRVILKHLIQIRLNVRVKAVHRARRRSVAGAVTVILQTAVDPRRALHQIDDLMQGNLLRRAPQRKAAVRPAYRAQNARATQRLCQHSDIFAWDRRPQPWRRCQASPDTASCEWHSQLIVLIAFRCLGSE